MGRNEHEVNSGPDLGEHELYVELHRENDGVVLREDVIILLLYCI